MERLDLADPASGEMSDRRNAEDRRASAGAAGAIVHVVRIRRMPGGTEDDVLRIVGLAVVYRSGGMVIMRARCGYYQRPKGKKRD